MEHICESECYLKLLGRVAMISTHCKQASKQASEGRARRREGKCPNQSLDDRDVKTRL